MNKYIVFKISGESLASDNELISIKNIKKYTADFDYFIHLGYKILVILGGGNIIRGRSTEYDKNDIDKAGMLATMINGLTVYSIIKSLYDVTIYSNIESPLVELYSPNKIHMHDITIIVGGSGKIGFSTDILMILAAIESHAEYVFKFTNVDGIYNKDRTAMYKHLSLYTMMHDELFAVDRTAVALAMENYINFYILNVNMYASSIHLQNTQSIYTYVSMDRLDELYNVDNTLPSIHTDV